MSYSILRAGLVALVVGFATSLVNLQAQPLPYQRLVDITKKKDRSRLYQVREDLSFARYAPTLAGLDELLERHPDNIDLIYMRATVHREAGNLNEAITDLERGLRLAPDYNYGALLELGRVHTLGGNATAAITAYERFLAATGPNDPDYEKAKKWLASARLTKELMANPLPFEPEPLPGRVNSPKHFEYFPHLSVDGQRLVFVRRPQGGDEDFYESYRQADGQWSAPDPLRHVNTDFNEGALTMSADGKLIIYTICGHPRSLGGCDLFYTESKKGKWSPVRNLGPAVNGRWRETQPSLSADGRLLFFVSNRPGGLGKVDIWGSFRDLNGEWSPAVNLGPTINSAGDDRFPFQHANGHTLYFTSDGHPGLGKQDLFSVELQDDNTWTEPRNLGYPINTPGEETNIFISLDGTEMFFVKELTPENFDIYTARLPAEVRPRPATYLRINVIDARTKEDIEAVVRLRPVDSKTPPKIYEADGNSLLVMAAGRNYAISVDQAGYLPYSQAFNLVGGIDPEQPTEITVELQPLQDNEFLSDRPIVLRNVLFATGSAELLSVSFPELDRLYDLLNERQDLRIELGGHTDNVGSEADNRTLSENRARAVYDYLLGRGIPADRLEYRGYGETQPVAPNDTPENRAENRRTEFKVL